MADRDLIAGTGITFDDTVADELTINASGGGGGAWVVISSQTVSSPVASVDFTSGIDGTYDNYVLTIADASSSAFNDLGMQFSSDGGSNYINTGYTWARSQVQGSGSISNNGSTSASLGLFLHDINSSRYAESFVHISGLHLTTAKNIKSNSTIGFSGGIFSETAAASLFTTVNINAIRLLMASGNIETGTFTLYGIKSS